MQKAIRNCHSRAIVHCRAQCALAFFLSLNPFLSTTSSFQSSFAQAHTTTHSLTRRLFTYLLLLANNVLCYVLLVILFTTFPPAVVQLQATLDCWHTPHRIESAISQKRAPFQQKIILFCSFVFYSKINNINYDITWCEPCIRALCTYMWAVGWWECYGVRKIATSWL